MRTNPCVRLVVFVCRGTDVWFFSFSKYSTAGPSSGSSVHLCRHDLLPHDTDMRLCKRGQRSCTSVADVPVSAVVVTMASGLCLYIMFDL